ncbi:MAG TPA: C25 family cysteine peptidase [bacterium]|nr:C25 family cysteine peptidase [bacterium]
MRFNRIFQGIFPALIVFALISTSAIAKSSFEVKNLHSGKNAADYIAIAPKEFLGALEPLLEKRRADGLRVVAVTPKQIYKEFDRRPAGPKAIRAFINYAFNHWEQPAPGYLLLAGDINVREFYDPKGVQIPTFIVRIDEVVEDEIEDRDGTFIASDAPFADIDSDEIPDLAVGRLPADNAEELKSMVEKIVGFETAPEPGPWRRRISMFASTGNFGIIDSTIEEITKKIVRNNFDMAFDINMTYGGSKMPYFLLPEDFGPKVRDRFNEGALFMTYIGHGGVTGFSDVCWDGKCRRIMNREDIDLLENNLRKTFFFSICCLTGKFNVEKDSIAEELVKNPKGPVGVYAASDVSHPYPNGIISKDMLYAFIMKRPRTIGLGLLTMQKAMIKRRDDDRRFLDKQFTMMYADSDVNKINFDHIYMYNYIGDPATVIPYPAQNIKITAPDSAAAGDTFRVNITTADGKPGRLIVSLDANQTEVIGSIKNIENLLGDELKKTVESNYSTANNKSAFRVETELDANGSADVEITVPDYIPGDTYFVKAYAWEGTPDSFGAKPILIENEPLRLAREAEEAANAKKPKKEKDKEDRLGKLIAGLKEPKIKKTDITPQPAEEKQAGFKALEKQASGPGNIKAKIEFAEMLIEKARYKEAAKLLTKTVAGFPGCADAWLLLAEAQMKTGSAQKAATTLNAAIDSGLKSVRLYSALYRAAMFMDNRETAESYLKDGLKIVPVAIDDPYDVFMYCYRARRLADDRDIALKKGLEILDSVNAADRDDLYFNLASLMLAEKDEAGIKDAIELMWRLFKTEQEPRAKALAVASIGAVYGSRLMSKIKSDIYFEKSLEVDPECVECCTYKWESLPAETAIKRCGRAMEIDPGNATAYTCLAESYYRKEVFDRAIENFEKARGLSPSAPGEAEILAYFKTDRRDAAIELLNRADIAARINPDIDPAERIASRIGLLAEAGEYEMAEKTYDSAKNKNFLIHHSAAEALVIRGEEAMEKAIEEADGKPVDDIALPFYEKAAALEKKAVRDNPYCVDCIANLADYDIRIGQLKNAENNLKKLLKLKPASDTETLSLLCTVMIDRGKAEEARKLLENMQGSFWHGSVKEAKDLLINPDFYFE